MTLNILVPQSFGGKDGKKALEEMMQETPKKVVEPVVESVKTEPQPYVPLPPYVTNRTFRERLFEEIIPKGLVMVLGAILTTGGIIESVKISKPVDPEFVRSAWNKDQSAFISESKKNKAEYDLKKNEYKIQAQSNYKENKPFRGRQ